MNDLEVKYKNKAVESNSFKRNIAFNLIIQILTYFIPIIITPYITRVLGVTGVGKSSYALSIVGYFSIIVSWGFDSFGSKKISAARDSKKEYSKIFWNIVLGKFIIFVASMTAFYIMCFTKVIDGSVETRVFLVASISIVSQFANISFLFMGIEKFRLLSIVQLITNTLFLISIFLFVKQPDDVIKYVALKTSQLLFTFLILWLFCAKFVDKPSFSLKLLGKCFIESIPFLVPTLAPTLATSIDQTMIGSLSSVDEVAYYQEALKIILLICALFYSVSPVGLSRFSYLFKQGKTEEVIEKTQGIFNLLAFVIFPSIVGLYIVGRLAIVAYLGLDFEPSIYVLYVLAPMLLTSSINSVLMNCYYYPAGKTRYVAMVFAVSLLINVCLNFFFIRLWGSVGAAISTLLTDGTQFIMLFTFSARVLSPKKMFSQTYKALVGSALMGAIVFLLTYFLEKNKVPGLIIVFVSVFSGLISYLGICLIVKEPISRSVVAKMLFALNKKQ